MVRVLDKVALWVLEAALWFILVELAVGFCNGHSGGVVVVRHGDGNPSAIVAAVPAAISLWRVAVTAIAAAVTSRLCRAAARFLVSALPPHEDTAGTASPPTGASSSAVDFGSERR
jgi:hypothetical protein